MQDDRWLAAEFEDHRARLRAVAYRMLGSLSEADDAVQEAWIRASRASASEVENLGGWLTTIVARVCLNALRRRASRHEDAVDTHLPDPIVDRPDETDPEHMVLLADSVGLALLVVLDRLEPAERVAFVLHDVFSVPFTEIAPIIGRTPGAARQLASRARRRVRGAPEPDADPVGQRAVVDAFVAAARDGDLARLIAVLDPDVVLRADVGAASAGVPRVVRGASAVAAQALTFTRRLTGRVQPALVNGAAGIVSRGPDGELLSIMGFTVVAGRIAEMDVLADVARLAGLDLGRLDGT